MLRTLLESTAKLLARHPRWMVGFALVYLISPWDLLPEWFLGPLGYLDDLVVLLLPYVILEYAKRLRKRPDVHDTTLEK